MEDPEIIMMAEFDDGLYAIEDGRWVLVEPRSILPRRPAELLMWSDPCVTLAGDA